MGSNVLESSGSVVSADATSDASVAFRAKTFPDVAVVVEVRLVGDAAAAVEAAGDAAAVGDGASIVGVVAADDLAGEESIIESQKF
jgi:hypothetical protein